MRTSRSKSSLNVAIVDYGMGNIGSVAKVLSRLNVTFCVSSSTKDLEAADRLILPGVGAFDKAMASLSRLKLDTCIRRQVLEFNKPLLGICLGMQLLSKTSIEGGNTEGLSLFDAAVLKLQGGEHFRLPHIGWNALKKEGCCSLTQGLSDGSFMYFAHDYVVHCNNNKDVICTTDYGQNFPSIINHGNIFGVQFHPEKSQRAGSIIMTNFVLGASK